ncbi:uncharacterized protein CIMG_08740 [Coccidioides immitis RS]|uniref:Uncharacterized protein n=1 Tax=Coccidioides immitis (strain RS) TaxID=246410 RepID=J3K639_COCIM|nr:uncharacterized protein CIMG_08740 [Coccidioides immitis RS]EAS29994.3 hypothetical protein CIMG_08740 [Coccidioides immitis RS]
MSVGLVLSQLETLVSRIELMGTRLSNKTIRPTSNQRDHFQGLSARLRAALAIIDIRIGELLSPTDKEIGLANQVRSAKIYVSITSPILTLLRRNLALIFTGPTPSNLDSAHVQARKKQTRTRCETLRKQNTHLILMWAMTIPPSTWKSSAGMTDSTFYFLVEELETERMIRISSQLLESLRSMAKDEPLTTCGAFHTFVVDVSKLITPDEDVPEQGINEAHTNILTAKNVLAIQYGRQIDYRCSGVPINKLPLLSERLLEAIQSSYQWNWERTVGGADTTDCLNALVPKNRSQDISITLSVGHENGVELIEELAAIRV